MSTIGPGSIGALNIAGSFAGAQRTESQADGAKAAAAQRKFQVDQNAMSAHALEDVGEADLTSERDPDGRLPYGAGRRSEQGDDDDSQQTAPRPQDAFGERGATLDLEA
jgi:hypothetical protein